MIRAMVKSPKSSEVLMFGDAQAPHQRAEIISVGPDGKPRIEKGGVMRTPLPAEQPAPTAQPAPPPAKQLPPKAVAAPPPVRTAPAGPVVPTAPTVKAPKVKNPGSAKEVSKALAAGAVGSVVDQLREKALAKGGVLTMEDIDGMQAEMATKVREIEAQMERAFESYTTANERAKWGPERRDMFSRLLVKQFSPMFKEPVARKSVCRRMLPGFSMAVTMLLGPNAVESYRDRCRGIVARLKSEHGDNPFDWDHFYVEKDALAIAIDAQLTIAAGFSEYDRRTQWFMTLVNSNLAPVVESDSEAVRRWELAEPGLRRMLDALLDNLRKVLSSEKGRERLIKRHGPEPVAQALTTLKRIVTG